MRYLAAILAAIAIVGAGALFVRRTSADFDRRFQSGLEELQRRGELTAEQAAAAKPGDFGLELSRSEMNRLQIADLLASCWFVIVPIVFALALALAAVTRRSPPSG